MKKPQIKPVYILGYSGLDGYLSYKNHAISDLSERESLVSQGMDAAAAIIKDGKIVAACAEERFTGLKHTGMFPRHAIAACLEMADIGFEDIAFIAHNFNYEPYKELLMAQEYSRGLYEEVLSDAVQLNLFRTNFDIDITSRFKPIDHHHSHAAYAFETSGYQQALTIIADGLGEYMSISVYDAHREEGLKLLSSQGPQSSLGMLYSAFTDYLGFLTNSDEYKIMGLAAYGEVERYKNLLDEIVSFEDKGGIMINHLIPLDIKTPESRETYRWFKDWLATKLFPPRSSDSAIEQHHKDIAAALQWKLNEAMLHIVRYWQSQTGNTNLCMAGGVALNCVANAQIAEADIFNNMYIAPASADDGTALGAALVVMCDLGQRLDSKHYIDMPFYGPDISLNEINEVILQNKLKLEKLSEEELVDVISNEIAVGKIVAWTEGGMEYGPRGLGHRSILADPRKYEMRERLNTVTKQRESFRPFAPIVKEESLDKYFDVKKGVVYKHMLVNAFVKVDAQPNLLAITHVDGTARVQSVSKRDLPTLWMLLDKVEKKIGIPILLNTSFNLKSMPIVCDDTDALKAFVNSDIDLLVIGKTIVRKSFT